MNLSKDREQKARILFQMASADQGKYYQWEMKNDEPVDYNDPKYDEKEKNRQAFWDKTKNEKYRTYFAELKKNYSDTKTAKDLQTSCLYYGYYSSK